MSDSNKRIRGFVDLDVYREAYAAMLTVFKKILPFLPPEERFDLKDQIRRSTKAIPRLIAEGHSKRHQKKGFQKYLDDALAESNETIVSLCQARDLYPCSVDRELCEKLLEEYDKVCRKIYNLSLAWGRFHARDLNTCDVSPDATDRRFPRTDK